jgi:hypothetical protein
MMMDLGFRKEDTGESTNRSAKLRQPDEYYYQGRIAEITICETRVTWVFALIRCVPLGGSFQPLYSGLDLRVHLEVELQFMSVHRSGLILSNEIPSDSSELLHEISSIPSRAL